MVELSTGAMHEFGDPRSPGAGRGTRPGLVLLYAEPVTTLSGAYPFFKPNVRIGRDAASDIQLSVTAVSRVHAEVRAASGSWTILDCGSRNGVLVDGVRVSGEHLEARQEVRIGDAIFKFVEHDAELYAHYNLDGSMAKGCSRLADSPSLLVGGFQMDRIATEIEKIAPTNLSVLILGESGTGKEVVASELHRQSGRSGRFVAVNCAAIPQNLIESELFGYRKGAFSGADRDKPGLIRAAESGTLFLDEIGDMPQEAQTKLLRVLQAREVLPVGATSPEPIDVRIACATHRDLAELQARGIFRLDLFARLNEYEVSLPPLRDRKEDLFVLTREFLRRHGAPQKQPSFAFMTALTHYDWPYNVRELEACIKRAIALSEGDILSEAELPPAITEAMQGYGTLASGLGPGSSQPRPLHEPPDRPNESELRELLIKHQGNVAAVGRELGKARMQIHRWAERYGLRLEDFREVEER
ncbi:MAG: sigma 54-interacting transcriptional regulator [Polyangiaceae bacterium]|nr:sigma 54-interacting transcriptional regulator [Polyangiaceae bacterium]